MVTAEFTVTKDQLLRIIHPVQYIGIDWETYLAISAELGENRPLILTFEKGILTIMPLSELHELLRTILHDFIRIAALSLNANIRSIGSATMRSRKKMIGVEPDLSYYVTNAGTHRVKDFVGAETSDVPDLVVEIDITHRSDDKFSLYGELGILEFWLYDGESLRMYRLGDDGYEPIRRSQELGSLDDNFLTEFLVRAQSGEKEGDLIRDFTDRLSAS